MTETKIIKYSDNKYEDPIAIVGFPGVGLVGSILTSFVIRELKMEVIAGITSPDFPPYALIQDGNPYPPIRIYGCKREKSSEHCGDLVIVTSEITLKPEQYYDVCTTLMGVFKELGIVSVVALEGIPQFDETGTMLACGTSKVSREKIESLGLVKLDEGLVRGLAGVMLYEGFYSNMDVLAILCPANPALPDPRSAAKILEPLSKMVPELKIDAEPLYKEAEELENKIKEQQEYANKIESSENQNLYG